MTWISTEHSTPVAYRKGDWDGKISSTVVAEDEHGGQYLAYYWEHTQDGEKHAAWVEANTTLEIQTKITSWLAFSPSPSGPPSEYYHLKEGEIVREGDEVEVSNSWKDKAKWVPALNTIGSKAPNPNYPAHRKYRRKREALKGVEMTVNKIMIIQHVPEWEAEKERYADIAISGPMQFLSQAELAYFLDQLRQTFEQVCHFGCHAHDTEVEFSTKLIDNKS